MKIRLGTRASLLARTQSGWVADQLRALEPGLEIEEVLYHICECRGRCFDLDAVGTH